MKRVVIIYSDDDWHEEIPFGKEKSSDIATRQANEKLYQQGLSQGLEFYRAELKWFNDSTNCFDRAWTFVDGNWVKINQPICPDVIYDKTKGVYDYLDYDLKVKINGKIPIFNHPQFQTLLSDKLNQYLIFGEWIPRTKFIADEEAFYNYIDKYEAESKLVIKPTQGSGGDGVVIDSVVNLKEKHVNYPILVQDYVEASGIPGISENGELADLRLNYFNHKPVFALSRVAAKDSLLTNISQGAEAKQVALSDIPEIVWLTAEKIVEKLKVFGDRTHYSLDFIFSENGEPVMLEMNTKPGFGLIFLLTGDKERKEYFNHLIVELKNLADKKRV